jgi:hypothetical protein
MVEKDEMEKRDSMNMATNSMKENLQLKDDTSATTGNIPFYNLLNNI